MIACRRIIIRYYYFSKCDPASQNRRGFIIAKPKSLHNPVQAFCARTATVASSNQEYQKYHRKYRRCTQHVCPYFLACIWARHRNDKGLPPTT
jgi:hypothetical protein